MKVLSVGSIICYDSMLYHVADAAKAKDDDYMIILG